jgi:membrane protein DedA with SNARE-associated domain
LRTLSATTYTAADTSSTSDLGSGLGAVADWVLGLMEQIGAPGAALAVALENLFPPIPSEVILPLAGFAASRGEIDLLEAILWTIAGSVVGASALYGIGAWLGRERMRVVVRKLPLVDVEDIDRTEAWFRRHGAAAVFFGRMIPLFRSLISIPAGIERMHFGQFLLLTTAGSAIWNTVFILAGFWLGEQWHVVERYAAVFQYGVIVAVVAAVVLFVVKRVRRNRRARAEGRQPG